MAQTFDQDGIVFRAGMHLFVIISIFASLFLGLGLFVAIKRGDWTFLAGAGVGTLVVFLLCSYLKLEIWEAGFTYRNLSGNHSVAFAEIQKAEFETITMPFAPQGVANFWIRLRDGTSIKINLRTFPIRAAACLFTALERHGIPVAVPDTWAARRMASEIRDEQAKLER